MAFSLGKTQTTRAGMEAWAGTAPPWKRHVKPEKACGGRAESRGMEKIFFRLLPGLKLSDDFVVTLDLLLLGRGQPKQLQW